jgi:hypothetical protein
VLNLIASAGFVWRGVWLIVHAFQEELNNPNTRDIGEKNVNT